MLASVETAADRATRIHPTPPRQEYAAWLARVLPPDAAPAGWVALTRLDGPGSIWLPAGLCLRQPPGPQGFPPPWPLSIGCAAGPSPEAARLHALLELVERDAAALWWRGGHRGRPVALEDPAAAAAVALLAVLRRGRPGRHSWLLDLTTDLGVPVMAALSTAADGRGFCCGLAARPGRAAAARAAVREMAQGELAHAVVLAKRPNAARRR